MDALSNHTPLVGQGKLIMVFVSGICAFARLDFRDLWALETEITQVVNDLNPYVD